MSSILFNKAFDAVADNKEEANELQIRADLMIAIRDIIKERVWKQVDAAEVFKLTELQVSDLLQGKFDSFSNDLLMTCLHRAEPFSL